jgi:hypothetical protein
MERMTPIYMLDRVLEWFSIDEPIKDKNYVSRLGALRSLAYSSFVLTYPEFETTQFEEYFPLILDHLEKDGYLKIVSDQTTTNKAYSITFSGKLFSQAGGYAAKIAFDQIKEESIKADLALRKRNDRRLVIGTFLVAFGAIALVLWEMYKTFCLEHH